MAGKSSSLRVAELDVGYNEDFPREPLSAPCQTIRQVSSSVATVIPLSHGGVEQQTDHYKRAQEISVQDRPHDLDYGNLSQEASASTTGDGDGTSGQGRDMYEPCTTAEKLGIMMGLYLRYLLIRS